MPEQTNQTEVIAGWAGPEYETRWLRVCFECGLAFRAPDHRHRLCSDGCAAKRKARLERSEPQRARRRERAKKKYWRERAALLDKLGLRDNYRCGICGGELNAPDFAEIDHIIPRSLGGSDDESNLQLTHAQCNRRKGPRLVAAWLDGSWSGW